MAAFIGPILAGITGLAGLFGGGKQQETSGNQTTNGTQTTSSNNTSTPNLSPIQQSLSQAYSNGLLNQYNQGTNLSGYTAGGLQQIGATGRSNSQQISNKLASMGQSYSPAAANAQTENILNTGQQQNQFMNQIPLLQRQLQQQNIGSLISGFSALPTGITQTGNGTQTTNSTTNQQGTVSGNPTAGLFTGLGSGLAAAYGPSITYSQLANQFPGMFGQNTFGGGGGGGGYVAPTESDYGS